MGAQIPIYSTEFAYRQSFSLPFNLICYIIENPSQPKVLQKLQQTFKYFFAKNKVVVMQESVIYKTKKNKKAYFMDLHRNPLLLPLGNVKYWFKSIYPSDENWDPFTLFITPHVYRIEFTELYMHHDHLSLNSINLLLSNDKMEILYLDSVYIRDDSGNPVPIDCILKKVPHLREINYNNRCEIYSNATFRKIRDLKFVNKLKCFCLGMDEISEEPDADILFEIIQKNAAPGAYFDYWTPYGVRFTEIFGPEFTESFKIDLINRVSNSFPNLHFRFFC